MSKQDNLRPHHLNGVKTYDIWDELVLYSPDREMAFALNPSAKAIWELCDGQHTLAEISRELGQRVGGATEELFSDVKTTIDQLHELGLLELAELSAPSSP